MGKITALTTFGTIEIETETIRKLEGVTGISIKERTHIGRKIDFRGEKEKLEGAANVNSVHVSDIDYIIENLDGGVHIQFKKAVNCEVARKRARVKGEEGRRSLTGKIVTCGDGEKEIKIGLSSDRNWIMRV